MRRDELRQPLRKRRRARTLWAKRPSALQAASLADGLLPLRLGAVWLIRTPYPYAGEPVVMVDDPARRGTEDRLDRQAPEAEPRGGAGRARKSADAAPTKVEILEPRRRQTVRDRGGDHRGAAPRSAARAHRRGHRGRALRPSAQDRPRQQASRSSSMPAHVRPASSIPTCRRSPSFWAAWASMRN